jgi:hypothetical protein
MAHLTKAQKRRMVALRTDMSRYMRDLMAGIQTGDLSNVIEWVNTGSVKADVEGLLRRELSPSEAVSLLESPEDQTDSKLAHAHMLALGFKSARMSVRNLLRLGRMEGIPPVLQTLDSQICEFEGVEF